MTLITVLGPGSYEPPAPSKDSYWTTPNPVVRAERSATGNLIGEYITTKYTVKWKYKELTLAQYAALYAAANNNGAYFSTYMRFWSWQENAYKTGYFYAASMTAGLHDETMSASVKDIEIEMIEQ